MPDLQHDIKERLARLLDTSKLKAIVASEVAEMMALRPADVSAEEFCRTAAGEVVDQLHDMLCAAKDVPRKEAATPRDAANPLSRIAEPSADLDGLIQRVAVGVELALLSGNLQMLRALGEAIAHRDTGNALHNPRVTLYAIRLGEHMELDHDDMQALLKGALMHDIGKIGISDNILLKRSGLSDQERRIMNGHTKLGAEIVGGVKWLRDAMDVLRNHHEKWDGSGYPDGLAGEAIPLTARLFAVADVFDALTSKRPYKDALPFKEVMDMMQDGSGSHFDPTVIASFTQIAPQAFSDIAGKQYGDLDAMLRDSVRKHFGIEL